MSFANSTWLNEPARWSLEGERLRVVTDARTDFWRETHYGFTRDSGHFLEHEIAGPFTAQLRIRARYKALYDQAGIMVRLDEARWIKAGIEWSDDAPQLGSVLTLGSSDWATGPFDGDPADFWLRLDPPDILSRSPRLPCWPDVLHAGAGGTDGRVLRLCCRAASWS